MLFWGKFSFRSCLPVLPSSIEFPHSVYQQYRLSTQTNFKCIAPHLRQGMLKATQRLHILLLVQIPRFDEHTAHWRLLDHPTCASRTVSTPKACALQYDSQWSLAK